MNAKATQDSVAVTLLYVPGHRVDRVRKALSSDADVVIIDLEDSVPPEAKATARAELGALLGESSPTRAVQVRVNPLDSPWGTDDLAVVASLPPHVEVRLPKVESATTVHDVLAVLADSSNDAPPRRLHCLLETARGVERALEIASADAAVASIGLGEADLASDLGITGDGGVPAENALSWVRSRVVVAARAAGLVPPAMSVYPVLHDDEGLAASTRAGRAMGFVGRCAIHPGQLPIIRRAFRPDPEEVRRARELLDRLQTARQAGEAAYVLDDGSFVDAAMVGAAERVLRLEAATR
ncbi:MAG TPA: CoA ester lyase [Actinopolymorphaceae bacterium]